MIDPQFENLVRLHLKKRTAESAKFEDSFEIHDSAEPEPSLSGPQPNYIFSTPDRQDRFGPYVLSRQIGAGGFGVVFLADDTRDGRQVALKLPMPHVMMLPDSLRRFRLDARIGLLLDHPDIVKVLEFDSVGPVPYIAAEFIDGPTLEAWFGIREGQVSNDEAVDIAIVLADALGYAHSRGIVHRDIKPANILMRPVSEEMAVVDEFKPCLTDFGLAHVNDELRASSASSSAALVGSIPYMAPEQILGDSAKFGPAADVYALGVILFRLLTGSMPFGGRAGEFLIHQAIHDDPPSMRSIKRGIPAALETICRKCLRKKLQRRYADAGALRDDLKRFRNGERILARPLPVWERAIAWARKHPSATVAGSSLAVGTSTIIVQQQARNRELSEIVNQLNRTVADLERSRASERQTRLEAEEHLRQIEKADGHRAAQDYDKILLRAAKAIEDSNPFLAQKIMAEIPDFGRGKEFVGRYLYRRATEKVRMVKEFVANWEFKLVPVNGTRKWAIIFYSFRTIGKYDQVAVYETSSWKKVFEFPLGQVTADFDYAYASKDEKEIVFVWYEDDESNPQNSSITRIRAKVWNVETGRVETSAKPDTSTSTLDLVLFHHEVSSDRLIVEEGRYYSDHDGSAISNDELLQFDLAQRKWSWIPRSNDGGNSCLSPHGKWICEKPNDSQLCVRRTDSNEPVWLSMPKGHEVDQLRFDADERYLVATASSTKHLFAWRLPAMDGDAPFISRQLAITPFRIKSLKYPNRILMTERTGDVATFDLEARREVKFEFDPKDPAVGEVMQSFPYSFYWEIPEIQDVIVFNTRHHPIGMRYFLWDLRSNRQLLEPIFNRNLRVCHSGHDEYFFLYDDNRIYECQPRNTDSIPNQLSGHADEAWCAAFTPDGSKLVTGSDDLDDAPTVKVWDWRTGKELLSWKAHNATVGAVAISPDGKTLATGALTSSNNMRLWNLETGALIAQFDDLDKAIDRIAISPDGRLLAFADRKGSVIVRDLIDDRILFRRTFESGLTSMLRFESEGRELVFAVEYGAYYRFALPGGDELRVLRFESDKRILSTDSSNLIGAGYSHRGRIFVADLRTGTNLNYFEMDSMKPIAVFMFPDGKTLAAGDMKGVLMMWDLETGEVKLRTQAHKAQINAITLSPDGRTLVTCAHDGSVRIWHSGDDEVKPVAVPDAS
jgi:serine/threonine protein kinase/WD40 repeat protein